MLWLSPGIKISISSKSGHSTFVLSTIDLLNKITYLLDVHSLSNSERTFDDNDGEHALVWKALLCRDAGQHLPVPRRLWHRRHVTHPALAVVEAEAARPGRLGVLEDARLLPGDEHARYVAVVHHDAHVRRRQAAVDGRHAGNPAAAAAPRGGSAGVLQVGQRRLRQRNSVTVDYRFAPIGRYREQLHRLYWN